ncbi:MAG: acyl-CoA carboxylase subunit beta [Candidatus Dormibacteria bacterium]
MVKVETGSQADSGAGPGAGGTSRPSALPTLNEHLINQLRKRRHDAVHRGGEPERQQRRKGKLSARERIRRLLDPGTFSELDTFVLNRSDQFDMAERRVPGDGVVTGFGEINGRRVFLFSHDASFMGGSLGEAFAEKVVKVMELAERTGCPLIGINDSAGARIQEGVVSLAGYADIFYRNVRCSGVVPQLSLIAGPCTGGAVYSPAITDFTFMVRRVGYMFITGPEVVRVTTGEEVDFEQLGGADIHSQRSGVAHFESQSEDEAFQQVRQLLSFLPQNSAERTPRVPTEDPVSRADPELQEIIPASPREPYEMREVIRRIVDDGNFLEVQALFAPNLLVGFARLDGRSVGVVANQPKHLAGALDIGASVKGARFVRFCDAFNIPLVTLVDVPGFLPGTEQEHGGIIRHGAKLLYAFAEATVPKLTVITRKAYGGAYDVMCSKHLGADYNAAWPTAEIAVMGAEGAVRFLARQQPGASSEADLIAAYREQFANPYHAAERGYIDDIIEPRQTRQMLVRALHMAETKTVERPRRRHGNIPL